MLRLLGSPRVNSHGPVAQLGARLNGIQEVTGSIPVRSTNPSLRSVLSDLTAPQARGGPCGPSAGTIPVRSAISKLLILTAGIGHPLR
jgi:hypothetical protein